MKEFSSKFLKASWVKYVQTVLALNLIWSPSVSRGSLAWFAWAFIAGPLASKVQQTNATRTTLSTFSGLGVSSYLH